MGNATGTIPVFNSGSVPTFGTSLTYTGGGTSQMGKLSNDNKFLYFVTDQTTNNVHIMDTTTNTDKVVTVNLTDASTPPKPTIANFIFALPK